MVGRVKQGNQAIAPPDVFRGIALSPSKVASAKARMAQAEAIADGIIAAVNGIASAFGLARHGSKIVARRLRAAFMKPAHR
jgi:hypothetical protein